MKPLLCALLACLICTAAWANAVPPRVEMKVSVAYGSARIGEGLDLFQHDGKAYSIVTTAKTVGLAAVLYKLDDRRESRGLITPKGLRPQYFEDKRNKDPLRSAHFDWNANRITLEVGDEKQTVELPADTFDQTSLPYALAFLPAPPERLNVHVTDGKRLTEYEVALVGKEKLQTELGELDTLHYRKVPPPGDKRGFEFWVSTAHHLLPVRVRVVNKNGGIFDSTVTHISYPPK